MFSRLREDLASVRERDPAARSTWEVLTCYPGVHALAMHRFAHWAWKREFYWLGRFVSHLGRFLTGIEIHPGATIGPGFFIDHGMGVVIGETAEVGANVTLYHGVTLGGVSLEKGKRHPTIGDGVVIGAGAKVLGPVTVGEHSRIGANSVLVKDTPPESVVVGVPGRMRHRDSSEQPADPDRDMQHNIMPDATAEALRAFAERLMQLETELADMRARVPGSNGHLAPPAGEWMPDKYLGPFGI